jgi:hypothetical protein
MYRFLFVTILLVFSSAAKAQDAGAIAKDLANPLASMISVPFQFNYDNGYGAGDGHKLFVNVQPVVPFSLNEDLNLISRTIIPLVFDQHRITNPLSGQQTGFGDVVQSTWLSNNVPLNLGGLGDLVWGIGPVALLPTGNSNPLLGTGKWGLGFSPLAVFINGPFVYGALVNHIWSVAGKNNRADVNQTFIQPFLTYTTKDAVTFSVNTETTYFWDTEEWSVPVHLQISKLTKFGDQFVSLQAGVRVWAKSTPTGPSGAGFRLAATFLFPSSQ